MSLDGAIENYLVIDFEFTVNTNRVGRPKFFFQEIIEVGAVQLSRFSFQIENEYQAFVKPKFFPRLTEECKNITLIKQEDVEKGLSLEQMIAGLSPLYQPGRTKLVAWGDADRDVLNLICQRYGIPYPYVWEDYIDLATEYKNYYQHEKHIGLKKALEQREIKPVGIPHSALDDTRNTALVLIHMIEDGWQEGAVALPWTQERGIHP